MKFVLVTGATGFLGSAVARKLISQGVCVRALVRSVQKAQELKAAGAEILSMDIRSQGLHTAAADIDTVIHCAAAIRPSSNEEDLFQSVNVHGTRNLVEAVKDSPSLRRFVHVSTVAVVGNTDPLRPADEQTACCPKDTYGKTKLMAEKIILDAVGGGFPAVIARPMWIYGAASEITINLFRKIALGKLPLIGSANNTMQPVAIDDAVAAILKCVSTAGIEGHIYHIAGSEVLTVRAMCETIASALDTKWPKRSLSLSVAIPLSIMSEVFFPALGINPPLTRKKLAFFRDNNSYSTERARRELDWKPTIPFDQGVREIAQTLRVSYLARAS